MHWKHYSGKIGSIPFFSSWNVQKLHHLLGCHAIAINSSLLFFSIALCFSYLMCHGHSLTIWLTKKLSWWDWKLKQFAWQKSCSDSRKNYSNMPDKKLFWIVIKITLFFIINSNNQELIYHSHSFGCIFYHQSKTKEFFGFHMFIFYDFYFKPYSSMNILQCFKHFLFNKTSLCSLWLTVAATFLFAPFCLFMLTIIIYQVQIHLWL